MNYQNIHYEQIEKYVLITINRPDVRNAVNDYTASEIGSALDMAERTPGVRALVLTGAGEKAFCAGGDIHKIKEKTPMDVLGVTLQNLCVRIENCKLPVIAAINGVAIGGGLEIALACDFRIAVNTATFALPELSLGLIPSAGGTQRLTRMVGEARAKEIIMLGERITAEKAKHYGMVSHVLSRADLKKAYEEMVEQLCLRSPVALYLAKLAIGVSAAPLSQSGMNYEKMCQAVLMGHADRQEGIEAFFEKREPRFI